MKEIYNNLKSYFEMNIEEGNIKKSSFIWVDYFEDEKSGFEHFVSELKNDKDYKDTDFNNLSSEEVEDISDEIKQKLSDSSFVGAAIRSQF